MDKWETLEERKKGDILLKNDCNLGEMPANLPEKIVGSKSYTASLITDLKKKDIFFYGIEKDCVDMFWERKGKIIFAGLSSRGWKLSYRGKRDKP